MFKYQKNSVYLLILCCFALIITGCETVVTEPGDITTITINSSGINGTPESEVAVVSASGVPLDLSALTEVQMQLATRIIEHLAAELQMSPAEVVLMDVEEVDWPDASLGCPRPGEAYAQMITSGYRMKLEVEGESHTYHTSNRPNSRLVQSCTED